MLTFGEQLSAREAYEAGLIAKVVPKDRFVAENGGLREKSSAVSETGTMAK